MRELPFGLAGLKKVSLTTLLAGFAKALVIILPPLFLFLGLNNFFAQESLKRSKTDQASEMGRLLGDITGLSEPLTRFDKIFRELSEIAFPSDIFTKRLKQIIEANPKAVDIFFYDRNGSCFDLDFLPRATKFVAQKFLAAIKNPDRGEMDEKWLIKFSGYKKAHKLMAESPQAIIRLGRTDDRQWGGYFSLTDSSGLPNGCFIVFISKSALNPDDILDQSIQAANQRFSKDYSFAWVDPCRPEIINSSGSEITAETFQIADKLGYGESIFFHNQRQGLKNYTKSGLIILALARRKLSPAVLFYYIDFTIKLSAVLGFICLFPLFAGISSYNPGLRPRLIGILLLGSGACMISLIFTGFIDRSDREKVLSNQYQKQNVDELKKIDEGLIFEFKTIEKLIKRRILALSKFSGAVFEKELKNLWKGLTTYSERFKELLVVSENDSFLFRPGSNQPVSLERENSTAMYGQMILNAYQGKNPESDENSGSNSVKGIISNSSSTFARNFILKGGNFETLSLAGSSVPTYIDFFLDKKGFGRAILLAFISRSGLQRNYLHQVSRFFDKRRNDDQPRFVAIPTSPANEWPAFPKRSSAENPVLKAISVKVVSRDLPVHEIAEINGRNYLFSAIKGKHLDGYVLILARPYFVIGDKIKRLDHNISVLALSIIALACLTAWLTSRLLLRPIRSLNSALLEISQGNFRVHLEPEPVREFDIVATSLNKTLEDFQEIKIARNIQENLWPEAGLRGNDWELEGHCQTATDLGGDHYDWVELEDGRVLIALGDVTGHGIGSAMIQASIKVWMAMKAQSCGSAAELLTQINRLHCRYGAKKLPMSCWAGFFEPDSGRLVFSSAGQSYPFIVDESGEVQTLKLPGMPLGIREKARYQELEVNILHGQSLILYTDGIVETANVRGEMYGFARLEEKVARIGGLSATRAIEEVSSSVREWGLQNDDQTIVILRRFAKKAENES